MTSLVPNRFLFDFEFELAYRAKPPVIDGKLEGWTDNERLPELDIIRLRKPTFTKPAPADLRDEVEARCQAVIQALAD